MPYINHSGGCPGADMTWEVEGKKYGVETIAYSFHNHVQDSDTPKVLTLEELAEGWEHVQIANQTLHRNVDSQYPYVKNLLSRNWFQIKNAEAVYAVGQFSSSAHTRVDGGTGWAVQMAIDNQKHIFFFDQDSSAWYSYSYVKEKFVALGGTPALTPHFAGIGTRELRANGIAAIQTVFQITFEPTP
jgi:hypothetical protein